MNNIEEAWKSWRKELKKHGKNCTRLLLFLATHVLWSNGFCHEGITEIQWRYHGDSMGFLNFHISLCFCSRSISRHGIRARACYLITFRKKLIDAIFYRAYIIQNSQPTSVKLFADKVLQIIIEESDHCEMDIDCAEAWFFVKFHSFSGSDVQDLFSWSSRTPFWARRLPPSMIFTRSNQSDQILAIRSVGWDDSLCKIFWHFYNYS